MERHYLNGKESKIIELSDNLSRIGKNISIHIAQKKSCRIRGERIWRIMDEEISTQKSGRSG